MERSWTFGQKLSIGFGVVVLMTIAVGVVAILALRQAVSAKDSVILISGESIIDAHGLAVQAARQAAAARGYLLDRSEEHFREIEERRSGFGAVVRRIRQRGSGRVDDSALARLEAAHDEHERELGRVIELRRDGGSLEDVVQRFERDVVPRRERMVRTIDEFVASERRERDLAMQEATESAASAANLLLAIVAVSVLLAAVVATLLGRALSRQIRIAVSQVQSSSAELQAAANQQATSSQEQATAMTEISTTISELLATSRQIADSAQRVADVAARTASSARNGSATVGRADEMLQGIRRQVDTIVEHMLELGRKSQHIGGVLDIVAELAEQTNILAVNATIEAVGAGDAGKRFAVVADEIRKLADRVSGSTKEVRGLIEDVRGAVNTTVMATEAGSKAVDSGTRQFGEVSSTFGQIAELVNTTTSVAREIELSTKQQTSAVEQVNGAISSVAQATKETEASSLQTLRTASELASLSRDLFRLVSASAA